MFALDSEPRPEELELLALAETGDGDFPVRPYRTDPPPMRAPGPLGGLPVTATCDVEGCEVEGCEVVVCVVRA